MRIPLRMGTTQVGGVGSAAASSAPGACGRSPCACPAGTHELSITYASSHCLLGVPAAALQLALVGNHCHLVPVALEQGLLTPLLEPPPALTHSIRSSSWWETTASWAPSF